MLQKWLQRPAGNQICRKSAILLDPMAGKQFKLEDRTTSLTLRVLNEDFLAFERLRRSLAGIPSDQLGRIIWHLGIWKSPDLIADVMRLALAEPDKAEDSG